MAAGDATSSITTNDFKLSAFSDGVDDTVLLGTSFLGPSIDGCPSITISAWYKSNNSYTGALPQILSEYVDGGFNGFNIRIDDAGGGTFKVRIGGRSVTGDSYQSHQSTATYPIDVWTHITGVIDFENDLIYLYVNGVLEGSTAVTFGNTSYTHGTPTPKDSICSGIGILAGGYTADIQVHKGTVSASAIYGGKIFPNSLVHRWNFSDGTFNDSVGSADGTASGTYLIKNDGKIAKAIKDLRVTANDKLLAIGTKGGQVVAIGVEEAP